VGYAAYAFGHQRHRGIVTRPAPGRRGRARGARAGGPHHSDDCESESESLD
jgi:hypothetical protein